MIKSKKFRSELNTHLQAKKNKFDFTDHVKKTSKYFGVDVKGTNLKEITKEYVLDPDLNDFWFIASDERKFSTLFRKDLFHKVKIISSFAGLYNFSIKTYSFANAAYHYNSLSEDEKATYWYDVYPLIVAPVPQNKEFFSYFESNMKFLYQNKITDTGYHFSDNVNNIVGILSNMRSVLTNVVSLVPAFFYDFYTMGADVAFSNVWNKVYESFCDLINIKDLSINAFWFVGLSIGSALVSLKKMAADRGYDTQAKQFFTDISSLKGTFSGFYTNKFHIIDPKKSAFFETFLKTSQAIEKLDKKIAQYNRNSRNVQSLLQKRQNLLNTLYQKVTDQSTKQLNELKHIDSRTKNLVNTIKQQTQSLVSEVKKVTADPAWENVKQFEKNYNKFQNLTSRLKRFSYRIFGPNVSAKLQGNYSQYFTKYIVSPLRNSRILMGSLGHIRNGLSFSGRLLREMIPGLTDMKYLWQLAGPGIVAWSHMKFLSLPYSAEILALLSKASGPLKFLARGGAYVGTFLASWNITHYLLSFTDWKKKWDNFTLDYIFEPVISLAYKDYKLMFTKIYEGVPSVFNKAWYYKDPIVGEIYLGTSEEKVPLGINTYKQYETYYGHHHKEIVTHDNMQKLLNSNFTISSLYYPTYDPRCLVINADSKEEVGYISLDFLIKQSILKLDRVSPFQDKYLELHQLILMQRKSQLSQKPVYLNRACIQDIYEFYPKEIMPSFIYNQTGDKIYDSQKGWLVGGSCLAPAPNRTKIFNLPIFMPQGQSIHNIMVYNNKEEASNYNHESHKIISNNRIYKFYELEKSNLQFIDSIVDPFQASNEVAHNLFGTHTYYPLNIENMKIPLRLTSIRKKKILDIIKLREKVDDQNEEYFKRKKLYDDNDYLNPIAQKNPSYPKLDLQTFAYTKQPNLPIDTINQYTIPLVSNK